MPTLRRRKASGTLLTTVTSRFAASALAVVPGFTYRPVSGDLFFGSATNAMFAATSRAVSGVPSAQVTPGRTVKRAVVASPFHFSARPARARPSAVTWISGS